LVLANLRNGAGTYPDVRQRLAQLPNRAETVFCAQCDFKTAYTARHQRFSERYRMVGVVDGDDRHQRASCKHGLDLMAMMRGYLRHMGFLLH